MSDLFSFELENTDKIAACLSHTFNIKLLYHVFQEYGNSYVKLTM